MRHEEAYIAGFCKAAEAAGVDPVALYKQAQLMARIAGGLSRGLGLLRSGGRAIAGSRFGQAVANGGRAIANSRAGQAVANSRAGQAVANGGRRFGQLLAGGANPVRGAFHMGRADLSSMKNLKGWMQTYWSGLRGGMGPEAASELRKALATRIGTGAAVLGAGKLMFGGDGQEEATQAT